MFVLAIWSLPRCREKRDCLGRSLQVGVFLQMEIAHETCAAIEGQSITDGPHKKISFISYSSFLPHTHHPPPSLTKRHLLLSMSLSSAFKTLATYF